jgi:M6 family metalloprotease-like protein
MLLLALALSVGVVGAQALVQPPDLVGTLVVRYGDAPVDGKMVAVAPQVGIYDNQNIYRSIDLTASKMTDAQLRSLNGHQINMYGLTQTERGMSVQQIQQTSALDPTAPITGQQPFAQILCAVPGSPTPKPHNAAWYEGLYRTKFPSLEDYMEKMSGGMVSGFGPHVFGWVNMPHPLSFYGTGYDNMNLEALWTDCTQAADSLVNFPDYVGVNMFFDVDLGAAWGGVSKTSLDGQTRAYRTTWYSNYADPINFIAHEYGHAYNMDHACGSESPCDGYLDHTTEMSDLSLKCDVVRDPTYGCIPQGYNAWDLYSAGWLTNYVTVDDSYREVTIEPLYKGGGGKRAILLRLNGTQAVFVELREKSGYDSKLLFAGADIHLIDVMQGPASTFLNVAKNHDDATKGAYFTNAGQKYTDSQGQFTICLISASSGAYDFAVGIGYNCSNGPPPSTPTPTPTPTVTPKPPLNYTYIPVAR